MPRSVTVGVTPASGNSLRLDIPGHSFLLESVGGQSAKEKRRELRQRLDSMGDELNDISRQMRSNRDVAYVRSPFLGDGANNLLRSLREGRTEEIPAYLKTISALRGKLDGY